MGEKFNLEEELKVISVSCVGGKVHVSGEGVTVRGRGLMVAGGGCRLLGWRFLCGFLFGLGVHPLIAVTVRFKLKGFTSF